MTDTIDDTTRFLKLPPPPRNAPFTTADVDAALRELEEAARVATTPGAAGERFTPGLSIAVVFRENGTCHVRYCDGHGVKDLRSSAAKPGADTLFPCASLSKPVSSTIIAKTTNGEWDRFAIKQNGERYQFQDFSKQTTVRQWLSHTSGLPDHAGDLIEDMNPRMTRDEIIENILKFQTGLVPGEHRYGNFGFTIGCLGAMHWFSKSDWESFSAPVLRDLGMSHSTYDFTSAFDPSAKDRVVPHQGEAAGSELGGWKWRVVDKEHERNPSRQAPAGALISSASDMAEFLKVHLEGRIHGGFPPRNAHGYSLGWNVANLSGESDYKKAINAIAFSHSGAFKLGASTALRIDPDAGIGIVILTNGEPAGVPEFLIRIFFNHLYKQPGRAAFEKDGKLDYGKVLGVGRAAILPLLDPKKFENRDRYKSTARPPIPSTVREGRVFHGHSDYYGCEIVIERHGDDLTLSMGEQGGGRPFWRFPLHCYDPTPDSPVFVYETTGENEVGINGIRLILGANNFFEAVIDPWLNQESPGADMGSGVGVIRAG